MKKMIASKSVQKPKLDSSKQKLLMKIEENEALELPAPKEIEVEKDLTHLPSIIKRPEKATLDAEKAAMFKKIHNRNFIFSSQNNNVLLRAN